VQLDWDRDGAGDTCSGGIVWRGGAQRLCDCSSIADRRSAGLGAALVLLLALGRRLRPRPTPDDREPGRNR